MSYPRRWDLLSERRLVFGKIRSGGTTSLCYHARTRIPTAHYEPSALPPTADDDDDEMRMSTLEPFNGDGTSDDITPQDFLRRFLREMGDKKDEVKVKQFKNYLRAGGEADLWYKGLSAAVRGDWDLTEAAFELKWPETVVVQKAQTDYELELAETVLLAKDLGKKETVLGRAVWTHVVDFVDEPDPAAHTMVMEEQATREAGSGIPSARKSLAECVHVQVASPCSRSPSVDSAAVLKIFDSETMLLVDAPALQPELAANP
ncbi:hypothetical protein B0H13DRAFT_1860265 [Mycena leptocephala]|nr:hypothetical protein B0H13DRAFT_1860265 [Mycena leptocephala]